MRPTSTTALRVSLRWAAGEDVPLGRLVLVQRRILFEYASSFLTTGLQPSPFHLKAGPGVSEEKKQVFDGLFGVFNDSLPDGWGRLLLDRHAARLGLDPLALTPLDRLACVGPRTIGALIYEPEQRIPVGRRSVDLDLLASEAHLVLAGAGGDVLPELLRLGGSPAGARPKALVAWRAADGHTTHGEDRIPPGHRALLVKFPARDDPRDIGAIEFAYAQMAQDAGLRMMPSFLLPAAQGPGYFGTERFDREAPAGAAVADRRLHAHTLSGLLHVDHRAASLDYEAAIKVVIYLTRDHRQAWELYRQMTFNVMAHNRDDHAKQFSFLMDQAGAWRLAPAYDLTFSDGPGGEHATLVGGEGRSPRLEHLLAVAQRCGLERPRAQAIIDEVAGAVARWGKFASAAGVGRTSRARIARALERLTGA